MRVLLKYIFWLLSFTTLVIYYLLGTTLGHGSLGYILESHYSKKFDNDLKIKSLDIEHYPQIIAEVKINNTSTLFLEGKADTEDMNMSYHLEGDSLRWDSQYVAYPVNVKGRVSGKVSELLVKGEGEVFFGDINYSFIRTENHLKSLEVALKSASSKELLSFLKYEFELEGDVDVLMSFEHFTSYKKKGLAKINMKKAIIPKVSGELEFRLEGEIEYKNLLREFFADVHSDIGKLRVANGYYNKSAGIIKADYGLHINELSYFEKLLKHQYQGELNTAGHVKYESENLILLGNTTTYGGLLEYTYRNNYLDLEFNGVSLEKLLRQLSFPALLSSHVYGAASYDLNSEIVLVNTELKKTRFRRTNMTDMIYEVTGIDILKDTYNDSMFTAGYQDSILTSFLKIDNGVNHLYLRDTRMNSITNEITADFEVQIEEQEFIGDIGGTLDDPQVNLDMSKLFKYQVNKKIENFFGKGKPLNKKNTKEKLNEITDDFNTKVENINLDSVKQKTRSFLDGFFD